MGIANRDYYRDDDYAGGRRRGTNVVMWLIIINVVVFVVQAVWPEQNTRVLSEEELASIQAGDYVQPPDPLLVRWFGLNRSAIFGGQVWRLLTYEFLHDHTSPWHIFFNMYFLYLIGSQLQAHYGSREFLLFYLLSGILSGVFSVFWFEMLGDRGWVAIGASGAVAASFILFALHWPHHIFLIFGFIPVQAMFLAILNTVMDVFPMLRELSTRQAYDGIAHSAHVGGMLFALVYYLRNLRIEPWLGWWRPADWKRGWRRRRSSLKVYTPETTVNFEQRMDELLQKIQEHGQASLTATELADLEEASRRMRNRKG